MLAPTAVPAPFLLGDLRMHLQQCRVASVVGSCHPVRSGLSFQRRALASGCCKPLRRESGQRGSPVFDSQVNDSKSVRYHLPVRMSSLDSRHLDPSFRGCTSPTLPSNWFPKDTATTSHWPSFAFLIVASLIVSDSTSRCF